MENLQSIDEGKYALGLMQGTFMLGASLGPLLGGPFIEHFGYYNCFIVSGVLVLLAGVVGALPQPKVSARARAHVRVIRFVFINVFSG